MGYWRIFKTDKGLANLVQFDIANCLYFLKTYKLVTIQYIFITS